MRTVINGKVFHYDPVYDSDASKLLESKPGERVRIFFANAQINDSVAFHPIAGIWDRMLDNGNPKNISYGMQNFTVAPAHGATFDLISPKDRPTNNALVDHQMKNALTGAISVLMNDDNNEQETFVIEFGQLDIHRLASEHGVGGYHRQGVIRLRSLPYSDTALRWRPLSE